MAYTLISTQTLLNPTATVTFSAIPQGFKDLVLELNGGVTTGTPVLYFRINNDSGTNYSHTHLGGNGTSAASGRGSGESSGWGGMSLAGAANDLSGVSVWNFMQYAGTSVNKTVICRNGAAGRETDAVVTLWRSTAAVSSLSVFNSTGTTFLAGSSVKLWGVS